MLFDYIGHYYTWANNKCCDKLFELSDEKFDTSSNSIKRSMRELVTHLIISSISYTSSYDDIIAQKLEENLKFKTKEELLEFWKKNDVEFAEKIHSNNTGMFEMPVSETKKAKTSREELIFTYTDHSTFHRGQILSLLREYGLEGINTDYYSYLLAKYT